MHLYDRALVWFRRDLRLYDHAALHAALHQSRAVFCIFVFDSTILQKLPRKDRRVEFIFNSLRELNEELEARGSSLILVHGDPVEEIPKAARELSVDAVFANRDYEPSAEMRDSAVGQELQGMGCRFFGFKDQAIFDADEVMTQDGRPFSVFTPYKNAWLKKLSALEASGNDPLFPYTYEKKFSALLRREDIPCQQSFSLLELGFEASDLSEIGLACGSSGADAMLEDFSHRIGQYAETRDYPALKGPSYLSVHLRFGTLSIRSAARLARDSMRSSSQGGAATWLSELIWRDFYFMILHHHPHVARGAFKPVYDRIEWEDGPHADEAFMQWCEGKTGYPLVDAAMRQMNSTGYMHNRLRMVTASFLSKDLGIDWRRGEAYFAEKLNDFDLAANNGGWQWAASSGCDAQPYFRIFNPVTQSEKFDPHGAFIRRYVPELKELSNRHIHAPWQAPSDELSKAGISLGTHYPEPVIDHALARERTLQRYAVVKAAPRPAE